MVQQLKEETWWQPHSRSPLWNYYDLNSCPVYTDPRMDCGHWEFRENGVVVAEGSTEVRW